MKTNLEIEKISTGKNWDDLVLPPQTRLKLEEMLNGLSMHLKITEEHGLDSKLRQSYKAFFYGPSGTGKTLSARILATQLGMDLYSVDLAKVISKYIGETEKNLSNLLGRAENQDYILLFDEADALFGKRTAVGDAHDRYANQEISFLLQRIEDYRGIAILTSNTKDNFDEAFIRRCNTVIRFPKPKSQERYKIWKKAFPANIKLKEDISLKQLSDTYDLTGAEIQNIAQSLSFKKQAKNKTSIYMKEIEIEIQKHNKKRNK